MSIDSDQNWEGEILYYPAPSGKSAMIATVERYWRDKCRDGRFPARSEIDPLDLAEVLPYLSIMDLEGNPFRARFRLVGTELARFYGREVRGKWVDEMEDWPEQDVIDTVAIFRRVHETGQPVFGLSLCLWQEQKDHMFEFACFPLSDDGRTVTHCLGIDDYTMIEPRPIRVL